MDRVEKMLGRMKATDMMRWIGLIDNFSTTSIILAT